jgi:hypothetical protein
MDSQQNFQVGVLLELLSVGSLSLSLRERAGRAAFR